MPEAISNTSPLLYLHSIGTLDWLPRLFGRIWIPNAVVLELETGRKEGHDVPDPLQLDWLEVVEPSYVPSEWLTLDLGGGELAAMALALENPHQIILLDDALARRTAQAAGLQVWGTLRVLIEAKSRGLTEHIAPWIDRLIDAGFWLSEDVRNRALALAGEDLAH